MNNLRENQMKNRRGTAAVEAALIMPVVFLVFLGAIDIAQYINVSQVVSNASREGARMASRNDSDADAVKNIVVSYIRETFPDLSEDELLKTVKVELQIIPASDDSERTAALEFPNSTALFYITPVVNDKKDNNGNGNGNNGNGNNGNGNNGNGNNGNGNNGNGNNDNGNNDNGNNNGGNNNGGSSSGELDDVERGDTILINVTFDFAQVRWLPGPDYWGTTAHNFQTYCRRQ